MSPISDVKSIQSHQPPMVMIVRILDSLAIGLALYLSTLVFSLEWSRIHAFYAMVAILMMQFFSEFMHLYQDWKINTPITLIGQTVGTWLTTCFFMFIFAILFDQSIRILFVELATTWVVFACINLAISRSLTNQVVRYIRSKGGNTVKVAIAGGGPLAQYAMSQLQNNPWTGYEIIGIYDDRYGPKFKLAESINNKRKTETIKGISGEVDIIGRFSDMYKAASENKFDAVFITMPMRAESKIIEILHKLSTQTTAAYIVPDFYSIDSHYSQMVNINGMPAVSIYENPVSGLKGIVKRLEDIFLTLFILFIAIIPMLMIAIAIKITSKGPIIFRQKRYGLDGKSFSVWKFRSMTLTNDNGVVIQATKNDVRVTPLGAFLRKTSLDELPQFINVLQGNMSIVGPRPHAVSHNEEYRELIKGYMLRHKAKPGITGWAQINGFRGETDTIDKMQNRIKYDIDYIRNWSVMFDLKIIFITIFKEFTGKNAY